MITSPAPTTSTVDVDAPRTTRSLWGAGLKAGVVAAVATTAIATVAHEVFDVSLADSEGEMIPLLGFAQVTLMCVVVGLLVATAIRRFARRPQVTWTRVAVGLTVVS